MTHKSIVIVGGGPVGLTMALKLAKQGKKVTVIDQGLVKQQDARVLALSFASCNILNELGAWPNDLTTAINCVQISHQGLGITQIHAYELQLEQLGSTIKYANLCTHLDAIVASEPLIQLICANVTNVYDGPEFATIEYNDTQQSEQLITAELVIMAEGGKLLADKPKKIDHNYAQQALIFHIKTLAKHANLAHERFGGIGPLVLLPFEDHYVVVWSLKSELAEQFKVDHSQLMQALDAEFTQRLGGATLLDEPVSFPLRLTQVQKRLQQRIILIGNSAQTVHPVSAQGLNLGLRDVVHLSNLMAEDAETDLTTLQRYDQLRNKDVNAVISFTHLLATKLESNNKLLAHLRGAGVIALSNLPQIKNFVARSLIFGL